MSTSFSRLEADPGASSDRALLKRVEHGDKQALIALYDRYSQAVYWIALPLLEDSTAAEKIAQDVFLQLWVRPLQITSPAGTMRGWMAMASRNRAVNRLLQQPVIRLKMPVAPRTWIF